MKNTFVGKSKTSFQEVHSKNDKNASRFNKKNIKMNKHLTCINSKERIFKRKVDANIDKQIMEEDRILKNLNQLNTSIFKKSKRDEIIELSDDSDEKRELIRKYVDSIKINTQNASINEEIDPTEDEIIDKLLEEKRNDTFNEEPIEDSSLSNIGQPITDEEKKILDELALVDNEIEKVKNNIDKIDAKQRKIAKIENKLNENSKNLEVNNQIEWEIMPKTNQISNRLDSQLEDILGKLSENEDENTESNNKRFDNLIEISESFTFEREESVLDINKESKNSLQDSEVTLDVNKFKFIENKDTRDQVLNKQNMSLKEVERNKEETKEIHRKIIPNHEKIKIYLMKELDKTNKIKSSSVPILNNLWIKLNQENLPYWWKRLLLDIKTVEEDISLCHLTNDKMYLSIYQDRLLILEKLVESINYHKRK